MGWTFYDVVTLPELGDIVWCKWPLRERRGEPGPIVRPVLVRESFIREDPEFGIRFGSVIVSYGTGEFQEAHLLTDLVITEMTRARELGLHKPTRFSLAPSDKKHLLWCEEYLVAPSYVRAHNVVLGRLDEAEVRRLRECLVRRGLHSEA
jgi:hypothetical protein